MCLNTTHGVRRRNRTAILSSAAWPATEELCRHEFVKNLIGAIQQPLGVVDRR